jgi:tetratricopeptide (TPR) repeat protein
LANLGAIYWHSDRIDGALIVSERALAISRQIGFRSGESGSLTTLGVIYRRKGDYLKALELFREALDLDNRSGDQQAQVADLANLGNVHQSAGDLEKAMEYLAQSLQLAERLNLPLAKIRTLFTRGLIQEKARRWESAEQDYRADIKLIEQVRVGLVQELHRIDFLADRLAPYRRIVLLLSRTVHRSGDALHFVERAKSRAFLDSLIARLGDKNMVQQEEPLDFQCIRALVGSF